MYDTIGMFLENRYLNESLISNLSENINKVTGEIVKKGNIENLRVKAIGNKVSIIGSFPKFYLGNNLQQLMRKDIILATKKLSDLLKLPLMDAKIFRLDIGYNFDVKLPVQNYLISFGDLSRFKKSIIANYETIQFCTSRKTLVFYDKKKEMIKHKQSIPDNIIEQNILRYEFRFNRQPAKSLNRSEVRYKDLLNEEFYSEVIDYWKDNYFKIHRMYSAKFNQYDLSTLTPKILLNQLAAKGLEEIGVEKVRAMIESSKDDYKHREQYQRLLRCVNELSSNPKLTNPNDAINELDSEIIRVAKENKL